MKKQVEYLFETQKFVLVEEPKKYLDDKAIDGWECFKFERQSAFNIVFTFKREKQFQYKIYIENHKFSNEQDCLLYINEKSKDGFELVQMNHFDVESYVSEGFKLIFKRKEYV